MQTQAQRDLTSVFRDAWKAGGASAPKVLLPALVETATPEQLTWLGQRLERAGWMKEREV